MSDFTVALFLFHKTQKKTTLSISSSNKSLGPSHPVEGHITWLSNKPLQMEEAEIWGVVVTAAKLQRANTFTEFIDKSRNNFFELV